jgi:hypothetical protein
MVLVYVTGSFELRVLTGLDIYGSFSGLSIDIYRWYRGLAICEESRSTTPKIRTAGLLDPGIPIVRPIRARRSAGRDYEYRGGEFWTV